MVLSKLFRRATAEAPGEHSLPEGQRVYAIGDIHGRLDLLARLVGLVSADDAARGPSETHLIFLGDLVDRGPDSAGVVDYVARLMAERPNVRMLMGNHEEVLLRTLAGDRKAMKLLFRIGGRQTLLSYGISDEELQTLSDELLLERAREQVPEAHRRFLEAGEDVIEMGDYAFVHAGIRPAVPLAAQKRADLRWIRGEFLDHADSHGRMIVHGHTITDEVEVRPNRIGIDTGAYLSGRLTALGIEGGQRWLVATAPDADSPPPATIIGLRRAR